MLNALNKKIFLYSVITIAALHIQVFGQQQSGRVYEFLNLPSTARITAMGSHAFPVLDHDLGMALTYPSLLAMGTNNHLSLNFVDYFDDINYGAVAFSHYFEKLGHFAGALQYVDYGRFIEADETGNVTGQFTAGEYSFQVGWGRSLSEKIMIGSNLKFVYSSFYEYDSFGMAVDLSVSYINPEQQLAAALVARNIGRQITYYNNNNRESLPFDLALGVSKKLNNAPFLFSVVVNNLHNYDLTYNSPVLIPDHFDETGDDRNFQQRASDIGDQLMRHITLGAEFIPTQNFSFRLGYNYRRRQEMKVDSRLSTVGFSWGFGFKISRFQLNYGRSNYHLAGAPNHISISTSLQELFQRSGSSNNVID